MLREESEEQVNDEIEETFNCAFNPEDCLLIQDHGRVLDQLYLETTMGFGYSASVILDMDDILKLRDLLTCYIERERS